MQLLDQEVFQKAFNGYYHDESFNEEQVKEKKRVYDLASSANSAQSTSQQTQFRNDKNLSLIHI